MSDGTLCSTVRWAARTASSRAAGSRAMSSGTMCTEAPHSNAVRNCHTEMSKLGDAVCAMRSAGVRANWSILPSRLLSMPAWVTIAPFGVPVDPDV